MKGVRGVSADNLPFYYKNKNIYHIEGGSFIGMITAPVLADSLINNKKTKINFNISRLYINTFIKILFLLAILWIIQFKLYIFNFLQLYPSLVIISFNFNHKLYLSINCLIVILL